MNCKFCKSEKFTEYEPVMIDFTVLKIQDHPDRDCNKTIHLVCENGHIGKYFCKLEKEMTVSAA